MVTQQLRDYINQQLKQGFRKEQIKNTLVTKGWQEQDIEAGFASVTSIDIANTRWKFLIIIFIGIAILGGVVYVASQTVFQSEDTAKTPQDQLLTLTPTEAIVTPKQATQTSQLQDLKEGEIIFADKLRSCTKYKTTFKHLLTGDMLEKEIVGMINGKCNYIEQMPNGGKMECNYSESERIVAAQYYKDIASAESFGTRVQVGTGEQKKTTYTINNKEVENPLEEAISSGVCIITGY